MAERNAQLNMKVNADQATASLGEVSDAADSSKKSLTDMAGKAKQAIDKVNNSSKGMGDSVTKAAGALGSISTGLNAVIAAAGQGDTAVGKLASSFGTVATAAGSGAAAFGPWGAVIGGGIALVTEITNGLNRQGEAHRAAANAADEQRLSIANLIGQMREQERIQALMRGEAAAPDQRNALVEAQRAEAAMAERITRAEQDRSDVLVEARNRLLPLIEQRDRLLALDFRTVNQNLDLQHVTRTLTLVQNQNVRAVSRADDVIQALNVALRTEQTNVETLTTALQTATAAEEEFATSSNKAAIAKALQMEAEETAHQRAVARARERRALVRQEIEETDRLAESRSLMIDDAGLARLREMTLQFERTGDIIDDGFHERLLSIGPAMAQAFAPHVQSVEEMNAALEANRQAVLAAATAQKELEVAAQESLGAFGDSWRGGIDGVIEALEEANEAARVAGTGMISEMDAAAMGVVGASKEMGEALMGDLAKGFGEAIKAAVKGEKSFGDAMASMLEDTLFSIGQQAMVLSIFEFAKAIADAASMNFVGAAAHAGAGAAFAAVAVAGFAGGGAMAAANPTPPKASATPSSSSMASNDNGRSSGEPAGAVTIVYNGNVFATRDEMTRDFADMLRVANERAA